MLKYNVLFPGLSMQILNSVVMIEHFGNIMRMKFHIVQWSWPAAHHQKNNSKPIKTFSPWSKIFSSLIDKQDSSSFIIKSFKSDIFPLDLRQIRF